MMLLTLLIQTVLIVAGISSPVNSDDILVVALTFGLLGELAAAFENQDKF